MRDARAFEKLYVVEWNNRVSAVALANLQRNGYKTLQFYNRHQI